MTEQEIAKCKKDFVVFLFVLWAALGLPKPTRCQIDMARTLMRKKHKRFILQAFRGIGKSFITCAYVVWLLWNNPQLKILIVSASKERAVANSIFIKKIIELLPFLSELATRAGQRDSGLSFDVGPATPDHAPSVKAVGITGAMTGSRADIILADDVEIPNNSSTQKAREALGELVKEFDAILKPEEESLIIYLGTPQNEMTLYKELEDNRGYVTIIWPARYPKDDTQRANYGVRLAPMLAKAYDNNPELAGQPTDPVRFDEKELTERELSYGKSGFMLQFMLDTNLGDIQKYPLKLRDLIVGAFDVIKAPLSFNWMPHPSQALSELPMIGLRGDNYYRYHSCSSNLGTFTTKLLVIDPSGRGKDETGYAVLYFLNGYVFLMEVSGFKGGYEDSTLNALALIAKKWKVNHCLIEGNFGDGMFTKLFTPILQKVWKCAVEETKSKGQKEKRIADTLEPIMGAHKLVTTEYCIQYDYQTAKDIDGKHDPKYSFFYQATRLTREKGALGADDRLDTVAIGCMWFVEYMERDSEKAEAEAVEEELKEHMEEELKGYESYHRYDMGDINILNEDDMLSTLNYIDFGR